MSRSRVGKVDVSIQPVLGLLFRIIYCDIFVPFKHDYTSFGMSKFNQVNREVVCMMMYGMRGHLFMDLSVEVGPYVLNPSPCSSFNETNGCIHNVSWRKGLTEYVQHVQIFQQALDSASEEANVVQDMGKLIFDEQDNEDGPNKCPYSNGNDYESSGGSDNTEEDEDGYEKDSSSPYILPPPKMRDNECHVFLCH